MDDFIYVQGRRILEDGTDLDADFRGGHPKVLHRSITDPVSDGSLGSTGYHPGQKNKDGSDL